MYSSQTEKWLVEIARMNNVSREKVIRYLNDLTAKKAVSYHLTLHGKKVLSHQ